jgi:hypothetical protein
MVRISHEMLIREKLNVEGCEANYLLPKPRRR